MDNQSRIFRKQAEDLTTLASQFGDNRLLQTELTLRAKTIERIAGMFEEKEAIDRAEAARRVKLADSRTDIAKRVKAVADDLGKDEDERRELKRIVEGLSDNCEDATCTKCPLCKFDYLKGKGLTKKQIRLVIGI